MLFENSEREDEEEGEDILGGFVRPDEGGPFGYPVPVSADRAIIGMARVRSNLHASFWINQIWKFIPEESAFYVEALKSPEFQDTLLTAGEWIPVYDIKADEAKNDEDAVISVYIVYDLQNAFGSFFEMPGSNFDQIAFFQNRITGS